MGNLSRQAQAAAAAAAAATMPNSPASPFPAANPGNSYFPASARVVPVPDPVERDSNGRPRAISVPLPADVKATGGRPLIERAVTAQPVQVMTPEPTKPSRQIDFWNDVPDEIKVNIFRHLSPKEVIRCSAVSKRWNRMCYDGQLWTSLDTSEFYRDIPSDVLIKIITAAGPFVRTMNLRGCLQMHDQWVINGNRLSDACRNLTTLSVEDCRIDRSSIHYFLLRNPHLISINMSKMSTINSSALKIIAHSCPALQHLNVSWCNNIDARGLKRIVESCPNLTTLKASELRGLDDHSLMIELHKHTGLKQLVLDYSASLSDDSLRFLFHGVDPQMDWLTGRPVTKPRKFLHLDVSSCPRLTDAGLQSIAYNVPNLQVLRAAECHSLTDGAFTLILESTPQLKYLDIDELEHVTNTTLTNLAKAPCTATLEHLSVSYCEDLGDIGMLAVLKACKKLNSVVADNTRISDLCLMEACAQIKSRGGIKTGEATTKVLPRTGMNFVCYDCSHVTWAGVREVLVRNSEMCRAAANAKAAVDASNETDSTTTVTPQIVSLKTFFGYQQTVNEHTKRLLRGDVRRAIRLERKWTEYMMASEEAGTVGGGVRRRQRRLREARRVYDDEGDAVLGGNGGGMGEDDDGDVDGEDSGEEFVVGGRRRARSGGCVVM